jgi:hypothetical protein
MANKRIRIYGRGHLHFIAFSRYRRLSLLRSVRARNIFVKILGEARDGYGFFLCPASAGNGENVRPLR